MIKPDSDLARKLSCGPALAGPLEVHRRVHGDAREPAPERGPPVAAEVPVRREEGLLDGVRRLVGVGDEPDHEGVAQVLVRLDQLVERPEIALERPPHEHVVATRDGLVALVRGGAGRCVRLGGDALAGQGRARVVQRGSAPSGANAWERRGGEAARV